ncbi:MAG: hypothetical protein G5663_00800 [Serratia symbiotica]|nr:hypothetical protein [Serratia symbiotica]
MYRVKQLFVGHLSSLRDNYDEQVAEAITMISILNKMPLADMREILRVV